MPETISPETISPETISPETISPETISPETVLFVQILNGGEYRGLQDPTTGSICMGGEVPLYYRTLQKSQEIQGILLLWTYLTSFSLCSLRNCTGFYTFYYFRMTPSLKVHKIFGFDCEICNISLLVMSKY
jgi:hypothetical protein